MRDCKILFYFLSVVLLLITSYAAATDIPLGSTLYASNPNETWSSPSMSFSLRFLPINSSTFSLAVTYGSNLPIWKAGAEVNVAGPGASFSLLHSGDLRLISGSGDILWRSNTSGLQVSHATLDDTGNLILKNKSKDVWSTFDNPTDTVVPSQKFTIGKVLTSGLYSFFLNDTANLTLQWNNRQVYWSLGLNSSVNTKLSKPHLGLQSIGILSLYDANLVTGSAIMAFSSDFGDPGDIFRFLKLDSDGNLRIYSSVRGTGTATVRWAAVTDQCLVLGYCGNMGICSFNSTGPVCGCPSENFEQIDPNDSRKGCKLKREIKDCPRSVAMLQMNHTRFLVYPPDSENPKFVSSKETSACRQNCLSGLCMASTAFDDGTGKCYMTSDFASGYHSAALPSTSYVKVCGPIAPNPPPPPPKEPALRSSKKLKRWVLPVIVLGTLVGFLLLEGGFWWWCCKTGSFRHLGQYALLDYSSCAPVQFSYKQLQRATRDFKEKLGEGGFGSVYRGVLATKTVVAVKQLEGIEQGEKQFRMEVATISSTHHLNLVRLIGFCSESRHRLLVYEFMKNGSLDSFLFSPEKDPRKFLRWQQRFHIALGTAKGITYLHEECRDCIVHCDIKPENILIDDNYNARVSDFGLAKLINPKDQRDRTLRSVRRTRGYLAPEWLANLPITSKCDVYSYGMVLLEIISSRRNFDVSEETNRKKFAVWAYEEFDKGKLGNIVDNKLIDCEADMEQVVRALQVTFWCIQEHPSQRPTMGRVVQMLEGVMEIEKPPAPKATAEGSVKTSMLMTGSINDIRSFVAPGAGPLSSSFQSLRASSSLSDMNAERLSSIF